MASLCETVGQIRESTDGPRWTIPELDSTDVRMFTGYFTSTILVTCFAIVDQFYSTKLSTKLIGSVLVLRVLFCSYPKLKLFTVDLQPFDVPHLPLSAFCLMKPQFWDFQ